jgi:hypothetical protein
VHQITSPIATRNHSGNGWITSPARCYYDPYIYIYIYIHTHTYTHTYIYHYSQTSIHKYTVLLTTNRLVTIQIHGTIQNILLLFKIRISTVYSQSHRFQLLDYYSILFFNSSNTTSNLFNLFSKVLMR